MSKQELTIFIAEHLAKRLGPVPRFSGDDIPPREGIREKLGHKRNARPKLVKDRLLEACDNFPAHIINNARIEAIDYGRRKMV